MDIKVKAKEVLLGAAVGAAVCGGERPKRAAYDRRRVKGVRRT